MKLLLDENVSPSIVAVLWKRGIDATSIRDRGKLGLPDHVVVRHAVDDDRIIVTANADDFTALCSGLEIHPGLVTIVSGTRTQQLAMIESALQHLERVAAARGTSLRSVMVNHVIEVAIDGACTDYELSD